MAHRRRGRFIVVEGIDGAGKSTVMDAIAHAVGDGLWTTREETDTWRGEAVRRSIEEGLSPLATTFYFLADRAAHVPEIETRLAAGQHVLCDRYTPSTLAYQGVTLAAEVEDVDGFLAPLVAAVPLRPDHVVLLDLDGETGVARVAGRGSGRSPYEKAAFLEQVRTRYLEQAEADPDRFTVIDADRPAAEVAEDAVAVVKRILASGG